MKWIYYVLIKYDTKNKCWDNTKKYYYVIELTKNTLMLVTYEDNKKSLEI